MENNSIRINAAGITTIAPSLPEGVTVLTRKMAEEWVEGYAMVNLIIPEGITRIQQGAFAHISNLAGVSIPNSVTSVEYDLFRVCPRLASITLPDSITSIGHSAFRACSRLTSINIPDGVTCIEYNAFRGCTGLTSINIPDSVTSIGRYAFEDCTSLTFIKIPARVTSIGYKTFKGCTSLANINIPDSVTSIDYSAFQGTSVKIYNRNDELSRIIDILDGYNAIRDQLSRIKSLPNKYKTGYQSGDSEIISRLKGLSIELNNYLNALSEDDK